MTILRTFILGLFAVTSLSLFGQGHFVNLPSASEGNTATRQPYTSGYTRFQQVYSSSAFGSPISAGGFLIQGMNFRLDSPLGFDDTGYVTNLQVRMSTTIRTPGSLSSLFAENVGVSEQVVFGPSTEYFVGDHQPPVPQFWQLGPGIVFSQPFLYRPSDGNLLMEIRVNGGSSFGTYLDAADQFDDSVGSVYGNVGDASGVPTSMGLVTEFYGTLIPEPSTWALLVLGASSMLLWRNKRRH